MGFIIEKFNISDNFLGAGDEEKHRMLMVNRDPEMKEITMIILLMMLMALISLSLILREQMAI